MLVFGKGLLATGFEACLKSLGDTLVVSDNNVDEAAVSSEAAHFGRHTGGCELDAFLGNHAPFEMSAAGDEESEVSLVWFDSCLRARVSDTFRYAERSHAECILRCHDGLFFLVGIWHGEVPVKSGLGIFELVSCGSVNHGQSGAYIAVIAAVLHIEGHCLRGARNLERRIGGTVGGDYDSVDGGFLCGAVTFICYLGALA